MQVTTIAKHWFQVHGVDARGAVAVRRKLRRGELLTFFQSMEPCLVGMEACATAHHWARELSALGHEVKLMPPAYVKAYVKRNKNDAADAEAICEAVTRPSMRFVPVKDAEQQSVLMLHRARNLLVRQRTMLVNALRAHMAEFGIIAPVGRRNVELLTETVAREHERLPDLAREILQLIVAQPGGELATGSEQRRIGDRGGNRAGAHNADPGLGRTSKRGDKYIRSLLIAGAVAVLRHARNRPTRDGEWVRAILARKPTKVAAVALANKTARIAWAVMMRGSGYQAKEVLGQTA